MDKNDWKYEAPEDLNAWFGFVKKLRPRLAKLHGERRHAAGNLVEIPESFAAWCRMFLPEYFRKAPSLMHRWMLKYLENFAAHRGEKLNVLAPRGGAKSTIGTLAYPLKMALEHQESYLWIVSDTHDQAKAHLENLRQAVVSNPLFREAYPVASQIRYRSGVLEFGNGVRVEAFGTGQKIRGRRHGANRPSLLVCDDLQNDAHGRSSLLRSKSREWFFGTLLKAGDARTNVIHLATALHQDALGLELTRTPGWKSRVFKAILRFPENMTLWEQWENILMDAAGGTVEARKFYEKNEQAMREGAVVLWEAEEDLYTLMKMRAESGHRAFEREKQNSPINPELCEWSEKYFESEHFWVEDFPKHFAMRILALDPSKGKDAGRCDYSAYVLLGMDDDGDLFVDARMLRCPVDELVDHGVELFREFCPDAFGVEGNQFQDLLADMFTERFAKNHLPPLRPWLLFNSVAKEVRIRRLSPYLASRKLHFRAGSPDTRLLVEQLRQFPLGDHDDGPDALEMAIRLLNQQRTGEKFDDGLGNHLFQGRIL
ncbi:MAG: hypothetical protein Q4D98_02365 [Planctomycetia bacterium]|nr:hypothetical protein [Planctomycetia bacterium]